MDDRKQGGLTGATGSLTPSDPDDEFVPAETQEMSDPTAARRITEPAHGRPEESDAFPRPDDDPREAGPILGGDERHDPEEEHL